MKTGRSLPFLHSVILPFFHSLILRSFNPSATDAGTATIATL